LTCGEPMSLFVGILLDINDEFGVICVKDCEAVDEFTAEGVSRKDSSSDCEAIELLCKVVEEVVVTDSSNRSVKLLTSKS